MERSIRTVLLLCAVGLISACGSNSTSALPQTPGSQSQLPAATQAVALGRISPGPSVHVCGDVGPGFARCHSLVRSDIHGLPSAGGGTPSGYGPSDLQTAYSLTSASTGGSGKTVAIIDAYDDPNALSDLNVYRGQFGLSTMSSTSTPWFKKVNQTGGTTYPAGNTGWAEEISLDVDMVSAICPHCNILLVEANSNSFADLATAANYGGSNANASSNSYGGGESSSTISTYGPSYNHPNVTTSSGDKGYRGGPQFPADLTWVTAVGGTSLTSTSGPVESAWSGANSGCSAYVGQPSWQTSVANITTSCGTTARAIADVSAVADPNTGVAVYDTYGEPGWLVFGGTSVSSPIIASVYALAGTTGSGASYSYSHTSSLNDITTGSNGHCRSLPICTAVPGWDGPTGNGSPKGTGAF